MLSYIYRRNFRRKRLQTLKPLLNERLSQDMANFDDTSVQHNSETENDHFKQTCKRTQKRSASYKRKRKSNKYKELTKNLKMDMQKVGLIYFYWLLFRLAEIVILLHGKGLRDHVNTLIKWFCSLKYNFEIKYLY